MSKNKNMADQLAALRKQAVNDDPHEAEAATATAPPPSKPDPVAKTKKKSKPTAKKSKTKTSKPRPAAAEPMTGRDRTAVSLTPSAVAALKKIQAFLLTDCGGTSASASAAMCIALEIAAEAVQDNPDAIASLFEEVKRTDGRRKAS